MGEGEDISSSLFCFNDYLFELLDVALDCGIKEFEFWDMTLDEVIRAITSKQRVEKRKAEENAMRDYILANLIGISVSRIYSNDNEFPMLYEVYPHIFNKEEIEQATFKNKTIESAEKFTNFALSFNKKYRKEREN